MRVDVLKIERAVGDGDGQGHAFIGIQRRVYGFQTLAWIGRLRFHVFHGEDPGEAFHDHPGDFWTLPLRSYVEQILDPLSGEIWSQVVPAWRLSFRRAEHAHRILGRWSGACARGVPTVRPGKIVTIFWGWRSRRRWQYLLPKGGKVHRLPWRRYLKIADRPEIDASSRVVSGQRKQA